MNDVDDVDSTRVDARDGRDERPRRDLYRATHRRALDAIARVDAVPDAPVGRARRGFPDFPFHFWSTSTTNHDSPIEGLDLAEREIDSFVVPAHRVDDVLVARFTRDRVLARVSRVSRSPLATRDDTAACISFFGSIARRLGPSTRDPHRSTRRARASRVYARRPSIDRPTAVSRLARHASRGRDDAGIHEREVRSL